MASPSIITGARIGIDRVTGKLIQGWAHCRQSIYVILTTRLNLRVMRLDFGSNNPNLLDKPGNAKSIALAYYAIYTALRKWEPGYRVTQFQLLSASKSGGYAFRITGIFYPRGHLGDYSISEPNMQATVTIGL